MSAYDESMKPMCGPFFKDHLASRDRSILIRRRPTECITVCVLEPLSGRRLGVYVRCDVTEEAEESPSSEPECLGQILAACTASTTTSSIHPDKRQKQRKRTLHAHLCAHLCALTYVLVFVLTDGREQGESASARPMALSVGQSRGQRARA